MRVMRAVEGQIGEERLRAVLRFQERQRLVGRLFAEMLRGDLRGRQLACREHVAGRGLERIGHATHEERAGLLERLGQRRRTVVPLPGREGRITGLPEGVGPGLVLQQLLIDLRERTPREQHGARRHARGALIATLHVGAGESHAALHQAIEVRRLDDRIAQSRDGVGTLVIGEDEDDVGRWRGGQGDRRGKQPGEETGRTHAPIQPFLPRKATQVQALKPWWPSCFRCSGASGST